MATHPNILAWKIPGTEKPGGLQSTGSQKSQTRLRTHTHTQGCDTSLSDWFVKNKYMKGDNT